MKLRRVAVVGAGAIGGLLGARLAAQAGVEVAALARGATLAALREQGWWLELAGQRLQAPVAAASDDPAALGPQDLLILALKAPALAALAPTLAPMVGPGTVILPAMNGVPWWFTWGLAGLAPATRLQAVDPDGVIAAALPPAQVIGCVVHMAARTTAPGRVRHGMGETLMVGEPQASPGAGPSARLDAVATLLARAGFSVERAPSIHQAAWYKLWGNVTMNPVSALTGATADAILDEPRVRAFCSRVMLEVAEVGARIGCAIDQTPEDRHAVTRKLGAFKTSMLQDVEAGRAVELKAIVGAVLDLAAAVQVATPELDTLYGLSTLMARSRGLAL